MLSNKNRELLLGHLNEAKWFLVEAHDFDLAEQVKDIWQAVKNSPVQQAEGNKEDVGV